jgi:DNA modification methylase
MTDRYKTSHQFFIGDAGSMPEIDDHAIDLVITSPPYPMIQMWDDQFSLSDPEIGKALEEDHGAKAFELMHRCLDPVWAEAYRILKPGGIAAINIGDATRTLNGQFQLFPNHARIITSCLSAGFTQLPTIIWRKPTNSPTKFMGSGMLPPSAYVTLEHEYILIFRKGQRREFDDDKVIRRQSAYFWEERNAWFSDVWFDLLGAPQASGHQGENKRTGAFPLDLPFRLIHMFSIRGDTVVDPFMGTGTTMIAAMCAGRNSIGYEIDGDLQSGILEKLSDVPAMANQLTRARLEAHHHFIEERKRTKGDVKYVNRPHGFRVMTKQEEELCLLMVRSVQYRSISKFTIEYGGLGQPERNETPSMPVGDASTPKNRPPKGRQMKLF